MNITIDWGDESIMPVTKPGELTYTYATHGTYTITISGTLDAFGYDGSSKNYVDALIEVVSFGTLGIKDLSYAFNYSNLVKVSGSLPTTVTKLEGTFYESSEMTKPGISSWDVSRVTSMKYMFYYAEKFDESLASWDVSKVTNMVEMFDYAYYFNQDISGWTISDEVKNDPSLCEYFSYDNSAWSCEFTPTQLPDNCKTDICPK